MKEHPITGVPMGLNKAQQKRDGKKINSQQYILYVIIVMIPSNRTYIIPLGITSTKSMRVPTRKAIILAKYVGAMLDLVC